MSQGPLAAHRLDQHPPPPRNTAAPGAGLVAGDAADVSNSLENTSREREETATEVPFN